MFDLWAKVIGCGIVGVLALFLIVVLVVYERGAYRKVIIPSMLSVGLLGCIFTVYRSIVSIIGM